MSPSLRDNTGPALAELRYGPVRISEMVYKVLKTVLSALPLYIPISCCFDTFDVCIRCHTKPILAFYILWNLALAGAISSGPCWILIMTRKWPVLTGYGHTKRVAHCFCCGITHRYHF